jgi:ATP/maltotriose-dependent transcriptional regulator MalT
VLTRVRLDHVAASAFSNPDVKAVFLAAPPGSGKSTWAADFVRRRSETSIWIRLDEADADPAAFFGWLTLGVERAALVAAGMLPPLSREHLAEMTAYARVWMRAFSSHQDRPSVFVLDDLHCVQESSRFAPLLPILIDESTSSRFLLLSRNETPPALARHRLNGVLSEIDPALLVFSESEVGALLDARGGSEQTAAELWQRTRGWPAATIAFASRAGNRGNGQAGSSDASAPRTLRHFIRNEILGKLGGRDLEVLNTLAALPYFRPRWPDVLVGDEPQSEARCGPDTKQRLLDWFVEHFPGDDGSDVCRMHPLFAEAVEVEANERLSAAAIARAYVRCAQLLRDDGAGEAAVRLLLRAHAWPEAETDLVAIASALLASARHVSLRDMARAVPETTRSPELWLALAQAEGLFDPAQGRLCAIAALERCGHGVDNHVQRLRVRALGLIIASYFQEFSSAEPISHWLDELRVTGASENVLDSPDLEATLAVAVWSGLFLRDPENSELGVWEHRVRAAISTPGDPNVRVRGAMLLAKHYWYTGQYFKIPPLRASAALHLNHPALQPYAKLVWYLFVQYDCWARADLDEGRQVTNKALLFAQSCGIHLLDNFLRLQGACFALLSGEQRAAADFLAAVEASSNAARRMEVWYHFMCRSWFEIACGATGQAIEHAQVALDAAESMGPSPLSLALAALANAQLRARDFSAAECSLDRLRSFAPTNSMAALHAALVAAEIAGQRGAAQAQQQAQSAACAILRTHALVYFHGMDSDVLRRFCVHALAADIDVDLIKQLIRKWRIAGEPPSIASESWPWPLKVYTLGRFSVLVDDVPVLSQGKVPSKIRELLQALIAFGSRDVAQATLAQALWADSEGDAADHALEVALHRLRRVIGKEAIVVQSGRIGLDPQRCWVDVWAFERTFAKLRELLDANADEQQIHGLITQLRSLYKGPFLDHDTQSWLLVMRERVRSRYLRALDAAAARLECAGRWPEAVQLLIEGLDLDPFTEGFYRRLMVSYQQLGQPSEALSAWRRCQRTLRSGLGISPSHETEALAQSIALLASGPQAGSAARATRLS